MSKNGVKEKSLQNLELLKAVVAFKMKFYRCPWATYEAAADGNIKLIPQQRYLASLEDDYKMMQNMIYGTIPEFESIIDSVSKLEVEINSLF